MALWDADKHYYSNDEVELANGRAYRAQKSNVGVEPPAFPWEPIGGQGVATVQVELVQPAAWPNPNATLVLPARGNSVSVSLTNPAFELTGPFTDLNGFGVRMFFDPSPEIDIVLDLVLTLVGDDNQKYGVFDFNPSVPAGTADIAVVGTTSHYAPLVKTGGTGGVVFDISDGAGADPGDEAWMVHTPDVGPWTAILSAQLYLL